MKFLSATSIWLLLITGLAYAETVSFTPGVSDYRSDSPDFRIPASAEKRVLEIPGVTGIAEVRGMLYLRQDELIYLIIDGGFYVKEGWEGIYHQTLVLKIPYDAKDWSAAEYSWTADRIGALFANSATLDPAKLRKDRPNQRPEANAGKESISPSAPGPSVAHP